MKSTQSAGLLLRVSRFSAGEEAGESHHTYMRGAGCLAEPHLMLTHSWSVETEGDTAAEFFSSFEFQFN